MNSAQIVLIEDNPADVFLVELALEATGMAYDLTRFTNGEDAVRVLSGPRTAQAVLPDAILLDLTTPRCDGFEVLVRLKQIPRLVSVPIAILTSSSAMSDKHRAHLQGTRYIEKPLQLEEFLANIGQAVKEMLNGENKTN